MAGCEQFPEAVLVFLQGEIREAAGKFFSRLMLAPFQAVDKHAHCQ
jgi:hypothetical protein